MPNPSKREPNTKYEKSIRLFQSDFLEFFTHMHPATPIVIYGPVILFFYYRTAFVHHTPVSRVIGLFILGLLSWSLFEYIMHRFVFHVEPNSRWGKRLAFLMHGVHHAQPQDPTRLVMPPLVSILGGVIIFLGLQPFFSAQTLEAFYPAVALGYVAYDTTHYAVHHFPMRNRVAKFLKDYHFAHHFKTPGKRFGVSSPLWDFVFGTFVSLK
jgi:sterol desaturase/sphingolipid hydroxylase (fatty acid hydroxylase superfamily)